MGNSITRNCHCGTRTSDNDKVRIPISPEGEEVIGPEEEMIIRKHKKGKKADSAKPKGRRGKGKNARSRSAHRKRNKSKTVDPNNRKGKKKKKQCKASTSLSTLVPDQTNEQLISQPSKYRNINCIYVGESNAIEEQVINLICKGEMDGIRDIFESQEIRIRAWDKRGYTPLYAACAYGHSDIVELLLINKAKPNELNEKSPENRGHSAENVKRIKSAESRGVGTSPLFIASQNRNVRTISLLLKHKAKVDVGRVGDGVSPLYMACMKDLEGNVKTLLKFKADINKEVSGQNNVTPLYIASEVGANAIVQILIKKKANINHTSKLGVTPLFIACHRGRRKNQDIVVKTLIDSNAEVNIKFDNDGIPLTPLEHIKNLHSSSIQSVEKIRLDRIKQLLMKG